MRLEQLRSSPVALETQETARVTNQRAAHTNASLQWSLNGVPGLELGLELEATVVDLLAGGRLLLQVGDSVIEADSPGGLSPGQNLRLRVDQLQPQIILHITEAEPTIETEAVRLLRQHLPAHADEGELLQNLEKVLSATTQDSELEASAPIELRRLLATIEHLLPNQRPVNAEVIKSLLEDGGLYYETKLARAAMGANQGLDAVLRDDLKGILLAALERADTPELNHAIHAQLNNIEVQQAVNLLHQLNDGAFQFQIPFSNGTGFSTATLCVERDGKHSDPRHTSSDGYRLLFLLDLENFGRTRIDAYASEQSLRVTFYVDRDTSLALLHKEIPAFQELLSSLGFRQVWLAARHIKTIPDEKRQKFDALAVGAPPSIHLIDVKV